MADPYYDPYAYIRDIQGYTAQQKALGQSKGISDQALSKMVYANWQAKKQDEIIGRELGLKEKAYAESAKAQREQARAQTWGSATNLAINAPIAYKNWKQAKLIGEPTKTPPQGGVGTTETPVSATSGSQVSTTPTPAITGGVTQTEVSPALTLNPEYVETARDAQVLAQSTATTGGSGGGLTLGGVGSIAGAGALGYTLGSNIIKGKHSKQAGIAGGVIAGWMAGAQAGSVGGPWGAVIGGVVGAISSIF